MRATNTGAIKMAIAILWLSGTLCSPQHTARALEPTDDAIVPTVVEADMPNLKARKLLFDTLQPIRNAGRRPLNIDHPVLRVGGSYAGMDLCIDLGVWFDGGQRNIPGSRGPIIVYYCTGEDWQTWPSLDNTYVSNDEGQCLAVTNKGEGELVHMSCNDILQDWTVNLIGWTYLNTNRVDLGDVTVIAEGYLTDNDARCLALTDTTSRSALKFAACDSKATWQKAIMRPDSPNGR